MAGSFLFLSFILLVSDGSKGAQCNFYQIKKDHTFNLLSNGEYLTSKPSFVCLITRLLCAAGSGQSHLSVVLTSGITWYLLCILSLPSCSPFPFPASCFCLVCVGFRLAGFLCDHIAVLCCILDSLLLFWSSGYYIPVIRNTLL